MQVLPGVPMKTLIRRRDTPEAKAFWDRAEQDEAARRQEEDLPQWRMVGVVVPNDFPREPEAAVKQVRLEEISFGAPFRMLAYGDRVFIRIQVADDILVTWPHKLSGPSKLNDDGYHVPIVELSTGRLLWMSKAKPCFIEPRYSDFIAGRV